MLQTARLTLRPIELGDAPDIHQHMNDPAVTTDLVPIAQPYTLQHAEEWIRDLNAGVLGEGVMFVMQRETTFVGTIYLHVIPQHRHAEIGYWLAKAHWGQGYATEAGRAVLRYGFEALNLNRIYAYYFTRNAASRHVLEKLGLTYEGTQRSNIIKEGVPIDVAFCAILRREFNFS
jgi:RimJ/RimL family protein N-acetyltransferase